MRRLLFVLLALPMIAAAEERTDDSIVIACRRGCSRELPTSVWSTMSCADLDIDEPLIEAAGERVEASCARHGCDVADYDLLARAALSLMFFDQPAADLIALAFLNEEHRSLYSPRAHEPR